MEKVTKNIPLSTGKVITHIRMPNGSQDAIPAMTWPECAEYDRIRTEMCTKNETYYCGQIKT